MSIHEVTREPNPTQTDCLSFLSVWAKPNPIQLNLVLNGLGNKFWILDP